MPELIKQANILGQFIYKLINMVFKIEKIINENPQEFRGILEYN